MIRYPFELSTTQRNHVGWLDVRQNDTGTQQFVATITTNDVTQDLTGLTAEFRTRQNDENVIIEKATITNEKNGVVEYVVSQYAMQQLGKNIGYFTFSKGDVEMFSTKDFCYYVNTSVTTFGLKGCDYIWRFEDLLEYVTDLANQSQVQLDKLINDVDGIQQQIDDMFALIASQGVLSADEVRQLLINFMSGEDIEVTDTFDFKNKIAGSNVENPHNFFYGGNEWLSLLPPTASWGTGSQSHYGWIEKLDGATVTAARYVANVIAQGRVAFNFLAEYKKRYPYIFKATNTDTENLALLKSKLTSIEPSIYAKGSNSAGNKVSAGAFSNTENTWWLMGSNTTADIAKMSSVYTTSTQIAYLLNPQGIVNINYYAGPATETVASITILDYAQIKNKIKFNISDFVATKAQYDTLKKVVDDHVADTVKHITAAERTKWNAKQDVPVDSGWITAVTSGVTPDGAKPLQYRRIGNKMYFRGGGTFPTTAGTTFLIISVAYAPTGQPQYFDTIVRDSDSTRKCIIQVQTDGACKIVTNSYSGNPIFFDGFEYLIA